MKLYRLQEGASKGWMTVSDDTDTPSIRWRLATKREFVWWYLTSARFSWLEFVAITIVANLIRAWLWP